MRAYNPSEEFKKYLRMTREVGEGAIRNSQTIIEFPNGFGASIVVGEYTYGGKRGLYELAVIEFEENGDWSLTYDTHITNDVIGYLKMDEVEEILYRIKKLSSNK